MRKIFIVLLILPIIGCVNQNSTSDSKAQVDKELNTLSHDEIIQQKVTKDSLRLVRLKKKEKKINELKRRGVFGIWRCDFSGYESIITFYKKNSKYTTKIDFTKSKMKTKTEKLKKVGSKYFVLGSKAKEYYLILDNGNLEMGDKQGLFTKALNTMPGTTITKLPKFNISDVAGKDIFYIAGNYSKSFAETLDGTNNKEWIVYYNDINVIFKVDKSTKKIISAVYKE